MIVYWAVPYLVVAALPVIVLLSVLLGGCTMTRPGPEQTAQARFHSASDSNAGQELVRKLDRRAARAELQRVVEERQR